MSTAKQLYMWHQASQVLAAAKRDMEQLGQEGRGLRERVREISQKLDALPVTADADQQIARLLLEQELWMARQEAERFTAQEQQRRLELELAVREQQFRVWELEQHLNQELLDEYERVRETKERPIVEVKNNTCMGCFLPLSLSNLARWRKGGDGKVVLCDECGRILV
ncbi:C4-type zinc ribbon domain-containing protein [Brevibacillus sp. B_LB10_24]|uniref:C4-type zinc ribbon domain-containing protein n=1 Tax=Brevibacillus sp. B_LB10_24 TaxID=3380645 RepID=UPI0038BCF6EC